jgi:glucan endo-1,3-beta-D-glucosidase
MRYQSTLLAAGALVAAASAADKVYSGFNSGATLATREAKFKADFKKEFTTAQGLKNAPTTFNAVRLYTNIQAYSESDPIEAFEAAIETKTYILLGIWTSGTDSIANELKALKKALDKHGSKLADLIIGMSIGSEDLYRDSETGVKNKAGVGAGPDVIVDFINQYKKEFKGSLIADAPIGHVDTWDAWTNSTNSAVVDAVDWIGVDEYPYYESGKGNAVENSGYLFDRAYNATVDASKGKPVWVTETGWPASGPDWDDAVPTVDNAQYYWQEIGCRQLFGKVNTFWYNLRDSNPDNDMQFAITKDLSTSPLFDLTCPTTFKTSYTIYDGDDEKDSKSPSGTSSSKVSAPTSSPSGDSSSGDDADPDTIGGDDSAAVSNLVMSWAAVGGAALAALNLL